MTSGPIMADKPLEPIPPGVAGNAAANLQAPAAAPLPEPFVPPTPMTLMVLTPMAQNLLAQARQEIVRTNFQFAVILAQAACELCTEAAIIQLMDLHKVDYLTDAVLDKRDSKSLDNPRLRKLFTALTRDDPTKEPWWSGW